MKSSDHAIDAPTEDAFRSWLKDIEANPGARNSREQGRTLTGSILLDGRFQVRRRLGQGGMGVVFEAYDTRRRSLVALKTLRHADAGAIYHFKYEFRRLADVLHPNLVRLYGLYYQAGEWLLSMEHVRGCDFLAYVRRGDELDEGRLRSSLGQLAQAVQAIHDAGKLHRDLKPSNVLVEADGRVVVLDFGLVREHGGGAPGQALVDDTLGGTPLYMAPEQAAGDPLGPPADWYAVGVMLYEALTGKLPFEGTPLGVLLAKQVETPEPPGAHEPDLPEDLCELCTQLIVSDPTRRPPGPAVLRRLGAAPAPAISRPPSIEPELFVGRHEELLALDAALAAVSDAGPVLAEVSGLSGMGKTSLVTCFLERLRAREPQAMVLEGRCHERESVPFKALDPIVDALTRQLQLLSADEQARLVPADAAALLRLFPVLERVDGLARAVRRKAPVDPAEARRRAFEALKELLAGLGKDRPLVVAIDDLQWGDKDSANLLLELVGPPQAPGMLLIVSYRADEVEQSECLRTLREGVERSGQLRHEVPVGPMNDAEQSALLDALLRNSTLERAELRQQAHGSPMSLTELAHWLQRRGGHAVDLSLDAAIGARIGSLGHQALRLLEAAALSGRSTLASVLGRAAELSVEQLEPLLIELAHARLLRIRETDEGNRVEVYHDRIRERVAAEPSVHDARNWHRRLAEALEGAEVDQPEIVARHWLGAGEPLAAAHHALTAAEAALDALAFDRAAELFEIAALHGSHTAAERADLRRRRADALVNAGRCYESGDVYLQAAAESELRIARDLRRRASEQMLGSGRFNEGMGLLKEVSVEYGAAVPSGMQQRMDWADRELARRTGNELSFVPRHESALSHEERERFDLCVNAALGFWGVDTRYRTWAMVANAVRFALDSGEPRRVLHALCIDCSLEAAQKLDGGRVPALLAKIEELEATIEEPYYRAWALFTRGCVHFFSMRDRQATQLLGQAEALWSDQSVGIWREVSMAHHMTTWGSYGILGNIEMIARIKRLVRHAEAHTDRYLSCVLRIHWGRLLLTQDDPEGARHQLALVQSSWGREEFDYIMQGVLQNGAAIDIYEGRPEAAFEKASQMWERFMLSDAHRVVRFKSMAHMELRTAALELARVAADPEPMLRLAAEHSAALPAAFSSLRNSAMLLTEAASANIRGDRTGSLALLDRYLAVVAGKNALFHALVMLQKGLLAEGPEGTASVADASERLKLLGFVNPVRFAPMMVPGFARGA